MEARLIHAQVADGCETEFDAAFEHHVLADVTAEVGFRGLYLLRDLVDGTDTHTVEALVLWDSAESATRADAGFRERRLPAMKGLLAAPPVVRAMTVVARA